MIKYRFRVTTPGQKLRSGNIDAKDLKSATKALEEAGYKILEIEPIDTGDLVVHSQISGATAGTGNSPGAMETKGYRPTVIDFFEEVNIEKTKRNRGIAVLGLIGLVVAVFFAVTGKDSNSPRSQVYQGQKIVITGKLEAPENKTDEVNLTFNFPEVPFQIQKKGRDVFTQGSNYRTEIEFESRRTPTYCVLTVTGFGLKEWTSERRYFKGKAPTCHFPLVSIKEE